MRVTSAATGLSSKGTANIEIGFELLDRTAEITGWLYLSDAAFDRALKVLRECFGFNDDFATVSTQLVGKECSITVQEEAEEKNGIPTGKTRNRVQWINPLRAAREITPVADSMLNRLTERAKRIARPADLPPPVVSRAAVPAAIKSDAIDDDVPF